MHGQGFQQVPFVTAMRHTTQHGLGQQANMPVEGRITHYRKDSFACMVLKGPEKVACDGIWEMRTSQMESPKNAKAVGL